jgi:tRNA dimethylallyltransferase
MRGVPHHLIDYVAPDVKYTAADWRTTQARKSGKSKLEIKFRFSSAERGFYLRALREPFFESPKTDAWLREKLKNIKERKGAEHLYRILERVDKASAAKLFPRDYVRASRALEVYFQTGKRISEIQPNRSEPPEFASRIKIFALDPPRDRLYERINRRAERHLKTAWSKK